MLLETILFFQKLWFVVKKGTYAKVGFNASPSQLGMTSIASMDLKGGRENMAFTPDDNNDNAGGSPSVGNKITIPNITENKF